MESARKHKVWQIKTKNQLRRDLESATKVSLILNCFKNIFEKKNVCILLHKMIQHMQKWGVVLYTQSLNYKGFRFYGHFKIFPMISYYALLSDGHNLM